MATDTVIDDAALERFTNGDCGRLAIRLWELKNWKPIFLWGEPKLAIHIGARLPDDRVIDIEGMSYRDNWREHWEDLTDEPLEETTVNDDFDDEPGEDTHAVDPYAHALIKQVEEAESLPSPDEILKRIRAERKAERLAARAAKR
jgi:hypothetical protein